MAIALHEKKDALIDALHADETFATEMLWFDGSVAVVVGEETLWLKIYRGKVIEAMEYVPVFGATISLTGTRDAWGKFVREELTFSDAISAGSRHLASYEDPFAEGGGYRPPEIAISGNGIEAGRVHIGLRALCLVLAAVQGDSPVSAAS